MERRKRKASVRYHIPCISDLKRRSEQIAADEGKTLDQVLDFYIKARLGDIGESAGKISKEYLRINKAKQCIDQAVKIMEQKSSTKLSGITRKFYKDMITYELAQISENDVYEN